MYASYFGLQSLPFSLLPDADFLYLGPRHARALHMLEYGLETQAGFVVLTGDVGSGKTTLLRRYVRGAGAETRIGMISNPTGSIGSLLEWVILAFDLPGLEKGVERAVLYHRFVDFLLDQYAQGHKTVLIIDEAQNLQANTLEELRMLSNVNNEKDMLLQIVLVGQPELRETLSHPSLRQFVQRISVHYQLGPLTALETARYIHHRLAIAGGNASLFDPATCAAIHFFTSGVPRLINLLCDQALAYSFADDADKPTPETVAAVVMDRAQAGLSPFKELQPHWSPVLLPMDTRLMIAEITAGLETDPATMSEPLPPSQVQKG